MMRGLHRAGLNPRRGCYWPGHERKDVLHAATQQNVAALKSRGRSSSGRRKGFYPAVMKGWDGSGR